MYKEEDDYIDELKFLFEDACEIVKALNLSIEDLFYALMHEYMDDIDDLIMQRRKDLNWQ